MDEQIRARKKSWENWAEKHSNLYISVQRSMDARQLDIGARDVVEKLSLEGGDKLIDIGCGAGVFLSAILNVCKAHAIGLDFSQPHIFSAKKNFPYVDFLVADMHDLPFRSSSFNKVLSYSVFHYVENWEKTLSEFIRICAPGGKILIGDVPSIRHRHMFYLNSIAGLLRTRGNIKKIMEKFEYFNNGTTFEWIDLGMIKSYVEKYGFSCRILSQPRHRQFESVSHNYRFDILIEK